MDKRYLKLIIMFAVIFFRCEKFTASAAQYDIPGTYSSLNALRQANPWANGNVVVLHQDDNTLMSPLTFSTGINNITFQSDNGTLRMITPSGSYSGTPTNGGLLQLGSTSSGAKILNLENVAFNNGRITGTSNNTAKGGAIQAVGANNFTLHGTGEVEFTGNKALPTQDRQIQLRPVLAEPFTLILRPRQSREMPTGSFRTIRRSARTQQVLRTPPPSRLAAAPYVLITTPRFPEPGT